ncbi:hypothetical protein BSKO_13757 [Bryopsis sp. KO-2023]|nr:hypothetical protein BSKO_13757 [Bryopsis sp. KO-2023]
MDRRGHIDDEELDNPLVERGWEYRDSSGAVRGSFPSELMFQWRLKGRLRGQQLVREVGTVTWTVLASRESVLRQRASARVAWKLFSQEPPLVWLYRDPSDMVQGPFPGQRMWDWFEGGTLYKGLKVSAVREGEDYDEGEMVFAPLAKLIEAQLLDDAQSPRGLLRYLTAREKRVATPTSSEENNTAFSSANPGEPGDFHEEKSVQDYSLAELAKYAFHVFRPSRSIEHEWFFRNPLGVYGPYNWQQMYGWFALGKLPETLEISGREVAPAEEDWESTDISWMEFTTLEEELLKQMEAW